jgi:diguanylate cyclase (GGDEF)-like protein
MASNAKCPACGQPVAIPTCPSCGAEILLAEDTGDGTTLEQAQTVADRDQTASDRDQTWSDRDQSSSDQDQRSADEDQIAADEDFTAGGDETAHDRSALARSRTSADRDAVSALRDEGATARLTSAAERDEAADRRDRIAERRDADARLRDLAAGAQEASPEDALSRAETDRARAAADREVAARERAEALRSRTESADNLRRATTDELTGARTRKFGLEEIARELARAQRNRTTFVLAFVDVDGLKLVNDTQGHLAGDALLQLVGETIRAHVRPYDVVVRYGGDELVCAMPGLNEPGAAARFAAIGNALKAVDVQHSVSVGLAVAQPGDNLEALLARADANLLESRRPEPGADGHC